MDSLPEASCGSGGAHSRFLRAGPGQYHVHAGVFSRDTSEDLDYVERVLLMVEPRCEHDERCRWCEAECRESDRRVTRCVMLDIDTVVDGDHASRIDSVAQLRAATVLRRADHRFEIPPDGFAPRHDARDVVDRWPRAVDRGDGAADPE